MKTIMKQCLLAITVVALGISSLSQAADRDVISIVGSSTVYPFATVVAERFGKSGSFKTPKIESTGTGGGMKLFCAGVGIDTPDITNASRAIKSSELEGCVAKGVNAVIEVLIGYDGIAFAHDKSAKPVDLTLDQLYLALAKDVPDPKGGEKVIPNPYKMWSDIDAKLPAIKIEVIGPPPTSGTRDAFTEMVIEKSCESRAWLKSHPDTKKLCKAIREDGAYIEAGENDNLIIQKLGANPNAFGIFGYSFLDQNADKVKAASIKGIKPEFETIANGSYPISRPLYFYVKKAHIGKVPGIKEFITEFTSKAAMGEEGYLAEKGLIPLAADKAAEVAQNVANLKTLTINAKLP